MKKIYSFFLSGWFVLNSLVSLSQISQGGSPLSFQNPQLIQSDLIFETMPVVDVERLQAEDAINDLNKEIPWRFGENIAVNFNTSNSGSWDIFTKGDRLWRLGIRSYGAYSINLTFDKYHLPPGAKLFIYDEGKTQVFGAFTDFNNQEDWVFATTLVPGEAVVVEYYEPADPAFPGELSIDRVTHGYRNAFKYAESFGTSGACNNNVACPIALGWEQQIRSVCMLVSGGSGFCTGVLVNNTSNNGVPYVLTANHCYSNPSSWVFWYNWQSPTCPNPGSSPPYNSMSGATLKARNTASDFCLVEMNTAAPSNYNVYYSGWNRADVAATSGACIHHPDGDIKKFSTSIIPFVSGTWSGTPANSHWQVFWDSGVTEPGSSGSPIFDQNHRVVGQLHGGPSYCGASQLWDFYGKFSMSWDYGTTAATRLKDWLDPTNIAGITLEGFDPALPVPSVVTLPANPVAPTTATLNGTVNPNGHPTTCYFEYGTSVSYGSTTTLQSLGSGTASLPVSASISGLIPGTTYHFRIAATNNFGTVTGVDLTFTPGAAGISTAPVTNITLTTATSGGNVLYDGGSPVSARGVCWGTSVNPTVAGSHTTDGSGTGTFTSSITGLTSSTTYHVRAYATNGNGTYYGQDLSFTTLCGIYTSPFSEGFPTTTIPVCWSQVDHQGNGQIWLFGAITGQSPNPLLNGHYAFLNSDSLGSGNSQNADLMTPVLDLSAFSAVNLQFNHYFKAYGGSSGTLSYSIDGGATWTQIQQFTATSPTNPTAFNQNITGVAGQAQVKFKWNYTGTWGYYWAFDDVVVTGTGSSATLAVTPSNQNVLTPAGSTTFNVVSNSSWTVTSDQTWCTVNPTGTGNGTITANYTQNTLPGARIANITVTVAGIAPVIVTVTQAGTLVPTLTVAPSNQNVTAFPGTTPFAVTSNTSWTVASNQTWCTVTPSGTGNGNITATYTQNPLTTPRVANITVTVIGLAPVVVTVTQAGAPFTLSVTPSNQNVPALAGAVSFTVMSNTNWNVASDQTWCTVPPSGSGNAALTATYTTNTLLTPRLANITFTVTGLSPVVVTVTQAGASPTLTVMPPNQNVPAAAGTTTFTVTSNTVWTAASDQTWCTVTTGGTGNGTINAVYAENTTVFVRVANITVLVNGISPVVVMVTQAGITPVLSVTPPNQDVTNAAGSVSYSVTSNQAWTANSNQPWCTITPSGSGSGTLTATYTQNTTFTQRVASITVLVNGLGPVVVTLTQAPAPMLLVTPANRNVPVAAGTTNFSVNSNSNWTAGSNAAWCTVTVSGSGNGTIDAVYQQNTGMSPRTAVITVTVTGLAPVTVTVSQEGLVGIAEGKAGNIQLFPNPNNGKFTIRSTDRKVLDMDVEVADIDGKIVSVTHSSGKDSYDFDLSGRPAGKYIVRITTADGAVLKKIIVE